MTRNTIWTALVCAGLALSACGTKDDTGMTGTTLPDDGNDDAQATGMDTNPQDTGMDTNPQDSGGMDEDTGMLSLWRSARALKIAPLNNEMILNYIAQHGIGLPRSY